jgi:predicted N-acyltransferase
LLRNWFKHFITVKTLLAAYALYQAKNTDDERKKSDYTEVYMSHIRELELEKYQDNQVVKEAFFGVRKDTLYGNEPLSKKFFEILREDYPFDTYFIAVARDGSKLTLSEEGREMCKEFEAFLDDGESRVLGKRNMMREK